MYHIGDISKKLNVSARTVRYYEELGLITAERSEGGFRVFSDVQFERLQTILTLKELGMSLDEINKLLHLRQAGATGAEVAPHLLHHLKTKKSEFEKKIEKYKSGINELENAIKIIEGCTKCHNASDGSTCEQCVDKRTDHKVPPLMKTLL